MNKEIKEIKVKMVKISNNENALRTNEISGICFSMPKVGEQFRIFSEGIDFGTRVVTTSLVQEIFEGGKFFKTLNSEYQLEVIDNNASIAQLA